ncbi:MAG: hypothetical protein PHW04_03585 [Candidatus Wallbacteria bacterium]|nr:hypothetical protein [Candidatus Wallbacteria bacterium]
MISKTRQVRTIKKVTQFSIDPDRATEDAVQGHGQSSQHKTSYLAFTTENRMFGVLFSYRINLPHLQVDRLKFLRGWQPFAGSSLQRVLQGRIQIFEHNEITCELWYCDWNNMDIKVLSCIKEAILRYKPYIRNCYWPK